MQLDLPYKIHHNKFYYSKGSASHLTTEKIKFIVENLPEKVYHRKYTGNNFIMENVLKLSSL